MNNPRIQTVATAAQTVKRITAMPQTRHLSAASAGGRATLLATVLAMAQVSQAAVIIYEQDFESPVVADRTTVSSAFGFVQSAAGRAWIRPTSVLGVPAPATLWGAQPVLMQDAGTWMYKNLTATFVPGNEYTLSFSNWTRLGTSSLTVSIEYGDGAGAGTILASQNFGVQSSPVTSTLTYTAVGADEGNAIRLKFLVAGGGSPQSLVDNIELSAIASGPTDPYDTWAGPAGYNLSGGRGDDDDNDGLTNFEEFAFGLNPTSGASVNPITNLADLATLGQFSYTRRFGTGLNYTIWVSTDLVDWGTEPVGADQEEAGLPVDGVETINVFLPEIPTGDKLFVRVKAE